LINGGEFIDELEKVVDGKYIVEDEEKKEK